jgi:hypothetical protein
MATPTRKEIEERIALIDITLADGISSVTTDGTTTSVDLASLRVERKELRRRLSTMVQPVSMAVNLGSF